MYCFDYLEYTRNTILYLQNFDIKLENSTNYSCRYYLLNNTILEKFDIIENLFRFTI